MTAATPANVLLQAGDWALPGHVPMAGAGKLVQAGLPGSGSRTAPSSPQAIEPRNGGCRLDRLAGPAPPSQGSIQLPSPAGHLGTTGLDFPGAGEPRDLIRLPFPTSLRPRSRFRSNLHRLFQPGGSSHPHTMLHHPLLPSIPKPRAVPTSRYQTPKRYKHFSTVFPLFRAAATLSHTPFPCPVRASHPSNRGGGDRPAGQVTDRPATGSRCHLR